MNVAGNAGLRVRNAGLTGEETIYPSKGIRVSAIGVALGIGRNGTLGTFGIV